jgi:hypothetical protein
MIEIPFPEKGDPELIRWSEQQQETDHAVVSDVRS